MLSLTRRALEDFDNQHDFERLATDVLNALGYLGAEPMAPRGGPDGGQDIRFMESDATGMAFVTLNKRIQEKFKTDMDKQSKGEGVVALFCNVAISPTQKRGMAQEAIAKGYRLEVFDIERLRSLLDGCLKDVRRLYLGIDDDIAARIRSGANKLLRFPSAVAEESKPPTLSEGLLVDQLPRRLFDLLMRYEESDVFEVPGIGASLHVHMVGYYQFRERALEVERRMTSQIGRMVVCRFPAAWKIYLRYVLMRFAGLSQEAIQGGGDFLNFDITWDDAERVYKDLAGDERLSGSVVGLFDLHKKICGQVQALCQSSSFQPREAT